MTPPYTYRAIVERVIDADSYIMRIDLGFRVTIAVPVRLFGINCPEIGAEAGRAAKTYVEALMGPRDLPTPLIVKSYKDRQSFARWIVDVWLPNGELLATHLADRGYGVLA